MKKAELKRLVTILISVSLITSFAVGCNIKGNSHQSISVNNEAEEKSLKEFIDNNHADLDINNEDFIKDLSILDEDAENYEIFLTGEGHAIEKNFNLKLALLKYFNQKAGVTYLLDEGGYSSAAFVNKYLETGDENILKTMYIELKGTAAWNKESYEFWKNLRDYNLTLDEDNKIKVIGIDIEHQLGTALSYLTSLIPKKSAPDKIHGTIDNFKIPKKELETRDDVKELVKSLRDDIESNTELYKEYLGDDFFDFSLVVDNIISTVDAYNSSNSNFNEIREKQIYCNFKKIYEHLPKGKYFGQFGMEHVSQRCYNSWLDKQERFAMYLNSDDLPLKGKVLSMAYAYKDCYRMTWPSNNGEKYGETLTDSGIFDMDIIDEYCEKDITVFKLSGENSPFKHKPYFVQFPYGGVTTDYYQYLIIIKDSRGATPLED